MATHGLDLGLLAVFFIYGLAFFGMGMAMALETGRFPSLAEARLLRPLAAFGLLHGIHEWLEIFLLQVVWLGASVPESVSWLRLALLAISFITLLIYGIQAFLVPKNRATWVTLLCLGLLLVYIGMISGNAIVTYQKGVAVPWLRLTDALIRYLLAVPGAMTAALGLRSQAVQAHAEGRDPLATNLSWAALGFGIYGLSQIFVPSLEMFPARWINTDAFLEATGMPVQVVRSVMAVIVMFSLLSASRKVEVERRNQFVAVQHARVAALEQIQVELTRREEMRRDLLRHIVRAQEDERARIARELHDETAQILAAFSLDLATLKNAVPDRADIAAMADRLQVLTKQISQGLYRLVHDLRPAQLDDLGLVPTLEYFLEQDCCPKGLNVAIDVQGKAYRLDPIVETVLFRVAQEAVKNVARHAKTKEAQIQLAYETEQVTLRVTDAGVGFDPSENLAPPRGWGLAGMRERVESVSGRLNIRSALGQGTTVEATIPVAENTPSVNKEIESHEKDTPIAGR